MTDTPIAERFWSKVDSTGDCWNWTAYTNPGGYGMFHVGGKHSSPWLAHRFAAAMVFGMFDRRTVVMHTCDNPRCVNPNHLLLGTHADNIADKLAKGRGRNQYRDAAACIRGHEFTPENTYIWRGRRNCRACQQTRTGNAR